MDKIWTNLWKLSINRQVINKYQKLYLNKCLLFRSNKAIVSIFTKKGETKQKTMEKFIKNFMKSIESYFE